MEDVGRVGAQHEDPDERDHARDDGGDHRARAEVLDHRVVAQAAGVPHEVHRGEVGARGHREHAAEDRRRVDPTRPRIAGLAPGRDAARRDRAGHRAHAVRHDDRRDGEETAEHALLGRAHEHLAEREARAAEHDAERGECQRYEQREHHRREHFRERGPQHDEAEDQPDVVGFPHRTDRVLDQAPRPFAARRAAGGQIPEPRAEVGAAEQCVRGDPEQQHARDDIGFTHAPAAHATGSGSRSGSGGSSRGP